MAGCVVSRRALGKHTNCGLNKRITCGSRSLRDPEVFVMEIQHDPAHSVFGLGRDKRASDSKLISILLCNFCLDMKQKLTTNDHVGLPSRRLRDHEDFGIRGYCLALPTMPTLLIQLGSLLIGPRPAPAPGPAPNKPKVLSVLHGRPGKLDLQ